MHLERFQRLRQPLWQRFGEATERLERGEALDYAELDGLAADYRRVLHDHAFARERYPETGVAERLRGLALRGARLLRVQRTGRRRGLVRFWRETYPLAIRRQLGATGIAAALFFGTALLGFGLLVSNAGLASGIVGSESLRGLADGELWTDGLMTAAPPSLTASGFATNNMSVAITAWAGGALAGLGAVWVTVLNGFHLGAVFAVTAHYSLAGRLGEFVAAHGPLEITLILVCAGAGLRLGKALVASDHRRRRHRLAEVGRQSLVVLVGCLPWFVLLGIVESFVSPSSSVSLGWKITVGLVLELLFVLIALNPSQGEI